MSDSTASPESIEALKEATQDLIVAVEAFLQSGHVVLTEAVAGLVQRIETAIAAVRDQLGQEPTPPPAP